MGTRVDPQQCLGVEHGDEGVEVTAAGCGEEGVDDLSLAGEVGGGRYLGALHAAACPAGEPDDVLGAGEPADYRTEERRPGRRAEVNDRRADVLAGQCQCLVALGPYLLVPPRVVEGVRQAGGQTCPGEQRLDEGAAALMAGVSSAAPGASKIWLLTVS
jgi:hypothetical protein